MILYPNTVQNMSFFFGGLFWFILGKNLSYLYHDIWKFSTNQRHPVLFEILKFKMALFSSKICLTDRLLLLKMFSYLFLANHAWYWLLMVNIGWYWLILVDLDRSSWIGKHVGRSRLILFELGWCCLMCWCWFIFICYLLICIDSE